MGQANLWQGSGRVQGCIKGYYKQGGSEKYLVGPSYSVITCSKLTIETLENGVVLVSLLLTLKIFHTLL